MEQKFYFKIGVNYCGVIDVAIPKSLQKDICQVIDKKGGIMNRFEFGFHFQEIVERDFPLLHQLIMETIHQNFVIDNNQIWYSLYTDWFEDELQNNQQSSPLII